jgi:hypothetical protein
LKDAISATKEFPGVTGKITLDGSRNAIKPAVVLELDAAAAKFTFKETIYPEGMTPPATTAAAANSNAKPAETNTNTANTNTNATK